MLRRLKIESLRAQLSATKSLLEKAVNYGDIISEFQLSKKVSSLEAEIRDLGTIAETQANVALFFGGDPVIGSYGIDVQFAGMALEQFQEIVSKDFAKNEQGGLGGFGPVPLRDASRLMITDTPRGSFGFVLEEMSDSAQVIATPLKHMVQDASLLIKNIASSELSDFEAGMARVDKRMLGALQKFFRTLDTAGATIRVVEDEAEFTLDKESVHRGRERVDNTEIEDVDDRITARIHGFMPDHKKFEAILPNDEMIYGPVNKEAVEQWAQFVAEGRQMYGQMWVLEIHERTVKSVTGEPKKNYRLIRFLNPVV